jgi:hypothetical protein
MKRMRHGARSRFGWWGVVVAALGALAGCGGDPEPTALALDDPNGTLTVIVGTFSRTCQEARSIIFECGRWELAVHLGPGAQSDGGKSLASSGVTAEKIVSDGAPNAQECSVLGGAYEQGTIEITKVSADAVTFLIDGTAQGDFDADGTFTAARCK